jgi:hypothetical protein
LPPDRCLAPERVAAVKRQAFAAILDQEAPRLTQIAPLIARLRDEISATAPVTPAEAGARHDEADVGGSRPSPG